MKKPILLGIFAAVAFGQTPDTHRKPLADRSTRRLQDVLKRIDISRLLPSVFNSSFGTVATQIITMPLSWTMDAKTCPSLKSTLHGDGEDRLTVTVTLNSDGTFRVYSDDQVTGTAKDDAGNTYIFIYQNRSTVESMTTLTTQPQPPFDFHGPDTFQLLNTSPNGTPGYMIAQYFRLHINADGSAVDLGSDASGNPGCDPI